MSSPRASWIEKLLSREPCSQKELMGLLRRAQQRQLIDHNALQMIEGVLAVSDKKVRDVMIPRQQMIALNANQKPRDVLSDMIHSKHSRFPVFGDEPDQVIGILLAKDLLSFMTQENTDERTIRDCMRPVAFTPESMRLDVLLQEFRQNRHHMAIVVDEYGNAAGLVTIEDVLEEIVGDIEDEFDVDERETFIRPTDPHVFVVNALTPIDTFNQFFKTHVRHENFDTIGGLIMQQFGRLPKRNEMIIFHHFEVLVLKTTRRGIQSLQFKKV